MKNLFYFIFALLLFNGLFIAQERMTVKPDGFDYRSLPKVQEINIPQSNETRVFYFPNQVMSVGPNVRIVPTTGNQTELSASIWTVNPNYVFVGANSDPGQGYYYTVNGGTSWGGGDLLPGSVAISSDPACTFSNIGVLHFNYFDNLMVSDRSTNGGANWMGRVTVPSTSFDKNHNTVDILPSSPYYGKVYVVWSNFSLSQPAIVLSYSTDGGSTYSAMQQIGAPLSGHYEQGCNIQTGPGGVVYCCWATPMSGSPYTETGIGFTKSTNGGVNWTTPTIPLTINGIRGNILSTNIRCNSFPSMAVDKTGGSRNGYIYVTWGQRNLAPAGTDADICFAYSSNGGTSWSTPVRVNDDALNNGKQQFFPWMTVDQSNGTISIVFYDTRDNATADSCNTYIATSTNGGSLWTNTRVSDHSQRPSPLAGYAGGYYGDYIAIAAHNNVIWPFWMDNRNGPAQVYTAKVTLGPPPAHDIAVGPFMGLPSQFLINTLYPVKARVTNIGTSNETGISVKFYINGTLINTSTLNLNAGQADSVSNNWTPTSVGTYNLKYVSTLAADTIHYNDTLQTNATVLASIPTMCPFLCANPTTYTPISGSPGPTGDDATITVPIGFTFQYKSNTFTQASICTNGWLVLGSTTNNAYNNDIATTDPTLVNMITGFWDDLNTNNGGNIQYTTQGSAPNRIFIAQWADVHFFSGTGTVTYQIKLYEAPSAVDGEVEIIYGTAVNNPSASGSVGINVTPGGSGNFTSITPGSSCSNTTYSTTSANNSVTYAFASGTHYIFCNPVGVQHKENTVPEVYSLSQNYPNPFNPVTVIKYALPKTSQVKLVVYDLTGKEVMTLVNGMKQAGNYEAKFDGSNIASGVYFYKLEAGDFTDVKKMVLVK